MANQSREDEIRYDSLWREDTTEDESILTYQALINSGGAWMLEGHVGRTAMSYLKAGLCILGEVAHSDYYENRIPSRYEVKPGTLGSLEYARELHPERWPITAKESH